MGAAGLGEYRRKRDFARTPEPPPRRGMRAAGGSFVVQKHAARRLHYDLRLELGGVLKSWAVPKGPSFDPREKRLAVRVEDHPLAYGSFEGTIPQGEYGGGTVMVWDRGRWTPLGNAEEGLSRGRLKFRLEGERLRGGWMLVRTGGEGRGTKGENWLLIKERDEAADASARIDAFTTSVLTGRAMEAIASGAPAARRASKPRPGPPAAARRRDQPDSLLPQLATPALEAPAGEKWVHEVKFDGYRLLAFRKGGGVRLLTRNGNDWTERFPGVASALSAELSVDAVIDGEAVVLDRRGVSDFQALQNAMKGRRSAAVVYFAFDLPWCDGVELARAPLLERKARLRELIGGSRQGRVRFSDHVEGHGDVALREACAAGLEGIISKRRDAPYAPGRSAAWLKVKCVSRQEFVIGGYTAPAGVREHFGALVVGYYDGDGRLVYAGRVGTGFTSESLRQLHRELAARRRPRPSFAPSPLLAAQRDVTWVSPELVAEVQFAQWTQDGVLRQPSFHGLREDKDPREVRREPSAAAPAQRRGRGGSGVRRVSIPSEPAAGGGRLTNPDRVVFPDRGAGFALTKGQLARYYEQIAPWILPHVAHRPLALVRCPDGEGGACFFQKHRTAGMPRGIESVELGEGGDGGRAGIMIRDVEGLLALVQMNSLEIHPWGARADRPDRPDRLVFDLDPGPGVAWKEVIDAARLLRGGLGELGLTSFVRTTGGKGLHVVVPIERRVEWAEAKSFCGAVARGLVRAAPGRYVATSSKARRSGKIYVDYLRNARGATAIGAYSTRARPGGPVAVPLDWEELSADLDPAAWNAATVPRRLASLGGDPWAGIGSTGNRLPSSRALTDTGGSAARPRRRSGVRKSGR